MSENLDPATITEMLEMLANIRSGTLAPTYFDESEDTAEYSNGHFSIVLPTKPKWE